MLSTLKNKTNEMILYNINKYLFFYFIVVLVVCVEKYKKWFKSRKIGKIISNIFQ